jgi:hypothetical protein
MVFQRHLRFPGERPPIALGEKPELLHKRLREPKADRLALVAIGGFFRAGHGSMSATFP